MHTSKMIRVLLLPFGLVVKLYDLAVAGSRDVHNKFRFRGSLIDRNCCIDPLSKIDRNCHILENCLVINSAIKKYSYIGRNSIVQNASIGSFCSIANDVFIGLGTHPTTLFSTSPLFYRVSNTFGVKLIERDDGFSEYQPINIGNDVWLGARATVMDGVTIGDGAIIAANAVVTKDVPPFAIVAGVPAKVITYRFSPEKIEELQKTQWWSWPLIDIQKRSKELNTL